MSNTTRTLEITMPDGYTADEVREHLARLPVKVKEPWRVARDAFDPSSVTERTPNEIRRWTNVVNACREGYVEKDKIEAALAERFSASRDVTEYNEGYLAGREKLYRLIREALK